MICIKIIAFAALAVVFAAPASAADLQPVVRLSFDTRDALSRDEGSAKVVFEAKGRPVFDPRGVKGGCVYFDGSSWLEATSFPKGLGTGASPFTAAFWFRAASECPKSGGWISWGRKERACGFSLRLHDASAVRLYWNGLDWNMPVDGVCNGRWHYLVLSHDGNRTAAYLDGLPLGTEERPATVQEGVFLVGRTMHDVPFKGWMDEVSVYAGSVNADEAFELYRAAISPAALAPASIETPAAALRSRPVTVSEEQLRRDGFIARMTVDLSGVKGPEVLWSMGPARLVLRMAGTEKSLDDYDRKRGNYLNFRLPDGSCPVLEATICDKAGRIGVPLGALKNRGKVMVTLRYASPSWRMDVGDEQWDEEFPVPRHPIDWRYSDEARVHSQRVGGESFVSPALPAPKVPDVRPVTRSVQYYTPDCFNQWAGDVALGTFGDTIHVFYLIDRRHHQTGAGGGRHQFAHLRSRDLVHWEELPLAAPITEDWQGVGTGTPFIKDGKLALAFGWHTDRFVTPSKEHPMGGTYSTSDDGIHFTWSREMINDAQNPSVYNRPDGTYELVTSYGGVKGIFRSKDLKNWELFDDNLPFRGDCPSLFDWHGHRYLLQGFSGMAYNPDGAKGGFVNWSNRPDALYEGLCVPMVTKWKDDRRIYSGWLLHQHGWGGWLVFREVVYYPDGALGLKWVPEIESPTPPVKFSVRAGERFTCRFRCVDGKSPDLLFTVDPKTREICYVDDVENPSFRRPGQGGNYRVGGVRGLDAPYDVRIIVHYDPKAAATIFDAEVAGQRTLIDSREGRYELSP